MVDDFPDPNQRVAEAMARWPRTIRVFLHHEMACVGCWIGPFETLAEVAIIYGLDADAFLRELAAAIEAPE